ncbi:FAD-dependent oxidoreductase [Spirosoma sordidisoli]|uniref:D-amino-acid oxidase n=1 Tax=Spirosoma sordidisoli TaxID=2502893 RepID=A0A4Q2UI71_9BACT|nr:FAD-dependent oxidoreductase [Spirosoma sordidisoli]RYC69113.1 FAD-binding oxidoreductase [Spirosoma sordidisoli]
MDRRHFLYAAGLGSVAMTSGCVPSARKSQPPVFQVPRLRLSRDRIVKETVGLRPFRASGPRIEKEMLGNKTIVHNYGHGGSGWSLSWGTGHLARELVLVTGVKKVALLGSGTVGLATARLLQEKGCEVTIYTKDLPPNVTSSLATGTWSPASRVCDPKVATAAFRQQWEAATRYSFRTFQFLLGMNDIAAWVDEYNVSHQPPTGQSDPSLGGEVFHLDGLVPERQTLSRRQHPFGAPYVTWRSNMMFNIPSYLHYQLSTFMMLGGKLTIREIKTLEDIDALPETCVVNCMGLGAKAIFNDEELTPVSGQLACLIPQSEVTYKLNVPGANIISRKDGIYLGGNGLVGNWDTTPKREYTEKWVDVIQQVMNEMRHA